MKVTFTLLSEKTDLVGKQQHPLMFFCDTETS